MNDLPPPVDGFIARSPQQDDIVYVQVFPTFSEDHWEVSKQSLKGRSTTQFLTTDELRRTIYTLKSTYEALKWKITALTRL